ncbi:translation initiation factor IF-2 subunit alpha [archaeon]|jgi:translation initiation factor 2 subunit 1|nr:translation initiation factor IF-2 subunit alpha [archaeon]MBT3730874.1 translation initiation factor IF-2 subunit alpha [archaeon]MBT4669887.1 translation initiation factor IF-2 subunit alpha [archaeon]MBT5030039.1 translation initiation factor IF-2 subunit alpha [archaeon]MBT5288140.1 translation initiation factor IF-2 subunit alpha [archaeon]
MFYKKKGLPDERDVIICTVKKILYHSIFVTLDEYDNQEGMIHISEIAPGRIRNIRDYVKEGKKLVCIVLKINQEKKQVDLSLRRVPQNLRIKKNEEFKQEIKSEKLLEYIGKQIKTDLEGMYKKVGFKLVEHFGLLGIAFNEIAANGEEAIIELKLPAKESKILIEIVQSKIKPPEVTVHCKLVLQSTSEEGVEDIKNALIAGEKFAKKKDYKISLVYISAPKYRLEIYSHDYKVAEEILDEVADVIVKELEKKKGHTEILRKK